MAGEVGATGGAARIGLRWLALDREALSPAVRQALQQRFGDAARTSESLG